MRTDLADLMELSIIRLSMQKQSPRTPKLQRTQNIQQNRFLTADLITPTSTQLIKVIMFIYIFIYTDANNMQLHIHVNINVSSYPSLFRIR